MAAAEPPAYDPAPLGVGLPPPPQPVQRGGRPPAQGAAAPAPALPADPAIVSVGQPSLGQQVGIKANPISRTSSTTRAHLTDVPFDSLPISELTKRGIREVMGYSVCSAVQAQTLPVILQGNDVIAKAKTGTGKTIAFLLPTIERMSLLARGLAGRKQILALGISPTRELATQIREEAEQLLTFHKPLLSSHVVFGGTNVKSDVRLLSSNPPSLLVATPGRLNDLLYNHGMQPLFSSLGSLIFDEADQLLEMGFRPDITKILTALESTRAARQTLLFSATLPPDVKQVANFATRGGPTTQLVDTVGEEKATHEHVPQKATVTALDTQTAELVSIVHEQTDEGAPYKVLVFFTTARLAQLYSELFTAIGYPVLEMHSRKSQPHRTRVAEQFRNGTNLIMMSSDVSARGMDYPDVTAVVQVGMPSDKAQYIHRLGRTARAGKAGGGYLLLADYEAGFLQQLSELPIERRDPMPAAVLASIAPRINAAMASLPPLTLTCAYQAYLGFYNSCAARPLPLSTLTSGFGEGGGSTTAAGTFSIGTSSGSSGTARRW